jgi:23S rRNA pseudouridine2605 synthase
MERLNKYLAHAGLGSRRHCDDLILGGHIAVDGQTVRELGVKIDPEQQQVSVDGSPLSAERHVYWLLNKPRGVLCTNFDPAGRERAIDLVDHVRQRVYPVGRLDEDSEGLLLLTNDGELANRLTHPRFGVEKTYHVQVAGRPTREDIEQLLRGVWLSDGHVQARRVRRLKHQGSSTWLEIVLNEGKNREIRRMLARLDHKVLRLRRVAIGPLYIGRLAKGKSRPLTTPELARLRRLAAHVGGEAPEGEPEAAPSEERRPPRREERWEERKRRPFTGVRGPGRTDHGPPRDRREGPPRERRDGPPRDRREGPHRDRREGPPRDRRDGPPRDRRDGPPHDRRERRDGPPRDRRDGPPRDRREGRQRSDERRPARGPQGANRPPRRARGPERLPDGRLTGPAPKRTKRPALRRERKKP